MKKRQIICGDSLTEMKKIKANSIDLVITDPPFAINFTKNHTSYNRKSKEVIAGYQDVKIEDYEEFTKNWLAQAQRVMKANASMYIISGWTNLNIIENVLKFFGFHVQNHIIWKYQFGVRTKKRFVTSHYHVLFVTKHKTNYNFFPNRRFNDRDKTETGGSARYRDMEDVWIIPREYWKGETTPTKLPEALIKKIMQYSSSPKDIVLDPFLGSGQVAVVAEKMHRQYIGIEIVKAYQKFALKRLEKIRG